MLQVEKKETAEIIAQAKNQLDVEGDFVELGCFEGDTSLLLAEILREKTTGKKLWIFDSFEGLPEKTEEDFSESGRDFQKGELLTSKRFVKQRFLRANLPVPVIKKAWFSELDPEKDLPEKVAFAFFDGDLYESIRTSFRLVFPKLSAGGKIIVHDYQNPQLPGVTKAVDEFLETHPLKATRKFGLVIISKDF